MNAIKKILLGALLVFIPYFIYKQYIQYIRFSPPNNYDYKVNPEIDGTYYNPETVKQLYQAAFETGNIARNMWYENQIDVRMFDGKDSRYSEAVSKYNQAKATAAYLEQKLLYSARLKKMGFSNDDIRKAEETGADPSQYPFILAGNLAKSWQNGVLKSGDNNTSVFQAQTMLKNIGIEMKTDGYFESITKTGVETFQKENGVFVTGIVNDLTYALLIQKTLEKNNSKKQ